MMYDAVISTIRSVAAQLTESERVATVKPMFYSVYREMQYTEKIYSSI